NKIDITIPVPGAAAVPEANAEAKDQGRTAIQRMLSAMGGADKLAAVQTVAYTAKLIQTTPMGEMSLDVKTTIAFPDKSCSVLVMPQGQIKMILNGEKGILVAPQGSMPAPEPIKQNMIENLFRDPLMLARQVDEVQAQWIGETQYQDKPVQEVIVSNGTLNYHLFIDKATSLPLAIKYITISQQGPTEVEERYEDYRDVNGIKVAWKTLGFDKGTKASESAMISVVMDGPVDPALFDK
ncbi:hypothetical protein GX408_09545, partial [bacterium]|nr:hypothetical protein [bacterium]